MEYDYCFLVNGFLIIINIKNKENHKILINAFVRMWT